MDSEFLAKEIIDKAKTLYDEAEQLTLPQTRVLRSLVMPLSHGITVAVGIANFGHHRTERSANYPNMWFTTMFSWRVTSQTLVSRPSPKRPGKLRSAPNRFTAIRSAPRRIA